MIFKSLRGMLIQTSKKWFEDKAPHLGASLAFYSMLSLGPLMLLALAAASLVFGHEAAQGRIISEIRDMVGDAGAGAIQDMITDAAQEKETGLVASLINMGILIFAASGVFGVLQDSMNTVWDVKPKPGRGIRGFLRNRFLSFTMVLGTGFLLLVSLLLSAALSLLHDALIRYGAGFAIFMEGLNFLISFSIISLLFCLIFKYIPDTLIAWRHVLTGGIVTAFLFTIGKSAIGFYLGHSSFSSSYGAAGSLVVMLVWVYYSAQIVLFGAEFTCVYARTPGKKFRARKILGQKVSGESI